MPLQQSENKTLVLVGLRDEAGVLKTAPDKAIEVICAASDPHRARLLLAQYLATGGFSRVLSFGIAGGLTPELVPGSIVIADQVFMEGVAYRCDTDWTRELAAALPQARVGSVQGVTSIAATRQDKQELHQQHQALICDMESPVVAVAAATARLPFASLRVVCDPAGFALPPAALLPLPEDGAPQLSAIMRSLLMAPRQLPALLALQRHYRMATAALAVAARAVT